MAQDGPPPTAPPEDPLSGVIREHRLWLESLLSEGLRTASVNVINGLVGLNFSCDGTHYLPVSEFLEKDHRFWFGG
ncbi:MAG: hypothetical protein WAL92_09160 [Thiogranum sp.]